MHGKGEGYVMQRVSRLSYDLLSCSHASFLYLLDSPYLCTSISISDIGVTSTTVFGAGIIHFAFCEVHVGFVHPALTAASTRNNIAAT